MTEHVKTGEVVLPSERGDGPKPLRILLEENQAQFAMAAPRGFEARQLVRDVQTSLRNTPKLLECEPKSVLGGAMTMAQLGLRVGVLGHGWLLPMWDSGYQWQDENGRPRRGAFRATLIIGYLGLKELAYRSGQIARMTAHTVYANDHFDITFGSDERLTHRPALAGDRGDEVGYYSTVKLRGMSNDDVIFHYMSREEAIQYRDRYAMARKKDGTIVGPWVTEFPMMAQKSCFRQNTKRVPLSTDLAIGLAVDETIRVDVTPDVPPELVSEHPALDGPHDAEFATPSVAGDLAGEPGPEADAAADQQWREQAKEGQP